jgi:hypothetical protein
MAQPHSKRNEKMNYKTYIISSELRSKHPQFLKQSRYRCAFFPWVKVGKKARKVSE